MIGVSESTIRRRIKDGTLRGGKFGGIHLIMGVDIINAIRGTKERYRRKWK